MCMDLSVDLLHYVGAYYCLMESADVYMWRTLSFQHLANVLISVFTLCYGYRTIILPVVLYGCETWSLTLREERRLRVFENRVFEESIWA